MSEKLLFTPEEAQAYAGEGVNVAALPALPIAGNHQPLVYHVKVLNAARHGKRYPRLQPWYMPHEAARVLGVGRNVLARLMPHEGQVVDGRGTRLYPQAAVHAVAKGRGGKT